MNEAGIQRPALGTRLRAIAEKWYWSFALLTTQFVHGGSASTGMAAARSVTVLVIGAKMLMPGILRNVRTFMAYRPRELLIVAVRRRRSGGRDQP